MEGEPSQDIHHSDSNDGGGYQLQLEDDEGLAGAGSQRKEEGTVGPHVQNTKIRLLVASTSTSFFMLRYFCFHFSDC